MKIGILTYHAPCNYGANLQAFTSQCIFQSLGHDVWIINYEREDDLYPLYCEAQQVSAHTEFVSHQLKITKPLHNGDEIADYVREVGIDLIVIGADAVWNKRLTDDLMIFSGDWLFNDKLNNQTKIVAVSPAFMGKTYDGLSVNVKERFKKNLKKFIFIAVRDEWTKKRINKDIFDKEFLTRINPDPVVYLHDFLKDYTLEFPIGIETGKYVVLTLPKNWLLSNSSQRIKWFSNFKSIVNDYGLKIVELPLPEGKSGLEFDYTVPYPTSPIEWFCWLRDARAFCGLRFHAVVSCISAGTPFFSVDAYGQSNVLLSSLKRLGLHQFASKFDKNSKIFNLLNESAFKENRINGALEYYSPKKIVKALLKVNRGDILHFRDSLKKKYDENLSQMFFYIGKEKISSLKIFDIDDSCTGCAACVNACPTKAIAIGEHNEGFYYPELTGQKCISCHKCEKVCPVINIPDYVKAQKAYYGWSNNDEVRMTSSSGGIFHALAMSILNKGGIVYGAAFNYEIPVRLEHMSTNDITLKALMKSKYVQSYIGDTFCKIEEHLNQGVFVLFCGTPCQVAGLKKYLGRSYENLFTCDFVCHGVASMDILRKHLKYKKFKNICNIDFRPKIRGWVNYFVINYGNNNKYLIRFQNDIYYSNFESSSILRKSCFECNYCSGNHSSDLTLADFWGYRKYDPSIYDKKGISLILANTDSGIVFLENACKTENTTLKEIDYKFAEYVYDNKRTTDCSGYNRVNRDRIVSNYYSMDYKKATKLSNFKPQVLKGLLDKLYFILHK